MNLFERKTKICYCVPNGASACAPCRERLAAKSVDNPLFFTVDFGKGDVSVEGLWFESRQRRNS